MAEKKTESKTKTTSKNVKKTTTSSTKKANSITTAKPSSAPKKKSTTVKKTNPSTGKSTTTKAKPSTPKKGTSSKTTKKTTSNKINLSEKKSSTKSTNKKELSSKKGTPNKEKKVEKKEVKPIKKIVSTQKKVGKAVSSNKISKEKIGKRIWSTLQKQVKKISKDFVKTIKIRSKKLGIHFKKYKKNIGKQTKQITKFIGKSIKTNALHFKNFLQSKIKKDPVKKLEKKNISSDKKEKTQEKKLQENLSEQKKNFKKTRKILLFIAIFCLISSILLKLPYGISTYKSEASNKILDIPKFVKLKEECCNYNATFSTPRSVKALKKEMDEIISHYELLNCDGKNYYYNSKENYTITEHSIKKGLFLNQISITYGIGNSCDIDTKFKKLELLSDDFSIQDAKKDGNYVIEKDKVINKKAYDDFMKNVSAKIPNTLRIVTSTKEGDVLITDLEYLSSGKYMVYYDGTRDRNAKNHKSILAYKFDHLKVYKNKLYAYNGEKLIIKNAKKYETYYLLTLPKE